MLLRALTIAAAILLAGTAVGGAAELANRGAHGEFFYDSASGLTWCDPDILTEAGRDPLNAFITNNSTGWVWASSAQIDALAGSTAPAGSSLEDVMGPRQFTAGSDWPRWIGYYAGLVPNGWLIQSEDNAVLGASGFQNDVETWNPGGWFVNAGDPTTQPRLQNVGSAGQYFLDQATALYWCDPAQFVGLTRAQIAIWLTAHPSWRWAVADEVRALVGRLSVGDVPLVEILGAAQFDLGGGQPRWIGYYAQSTEPDGLLLQADIDPYRCIMTAFGTQMGVATWGPGAWVVTDSDPTPIDGASWGEVKHTYR
jgi:hypothetical protein